MAVAKPRTRVVYFRVTDEEFRMCVEACQAGTARSVSDLVRNAVMSTIGGRAARRDDVARGEEMNERLLLLEETVRELKDRLELNASGHNSLSPAGDAKEVSE